MIFNTRLGRFFVVDSLRLDLARPIEEINSALQPIFELIFLFFTAVLCRSKHVWTRIGPWGSQCLPLPWGSATLQASIKLHSFNLKITIKHLQHPRQHQLFQNLIEVANEVNSWAKWVGPNENFAPQTPPKGAWIAGTWWRAGCTLRATESPGVGWMELYMNFIEFHYLSVTLKLNIDKGPAHHLLRCYPTLGSRTPGYSSKFWKGLDWFYFHGDWMIRFERWVGWQQVPLWSSLMWMVRSDIVLNLTRQAMLCHAMPCYSLPTFFLEKIEISSPVHLLGVVQDLDIAEMRDFVAAFREGTLKVHGFREILLLLIG